MKTTSEQSGRNLLKPISLFYAYAREDEPLRRRLESQLSLLRQRGLIAEWYDRNVVAGTDWAQAIDRHMSSADIILLLVSPDFMASDYTYSIEMIRALERQIAAQTVR